MGTQEKVLTYLKCVETFIKDLLKSLFFKIVYDSTTKINK